MRPIYLIGFIFILLCCSSNVDAFGESDIDLERIVVTGERANKSANYTVLTRSDFINKAQSLSDILNQINGIQIRQISGVGNPVAVSIRGSSSKQVQLYIDGQLINDGQFGGFDLNQIPVEHIQSIELSKDQTIGTGSTPIGGAIRINTYNASKEVLRLSAGLGSFGMQEFNLTNNLVFSHGHVSVAASHLSSDNDYSFLVKQPIANPGHSETMPLLNNEFEKNTVSINGEIRHEFHQLRINWQYTKQDKALPLYRNNAPTNVSSLDNETTRVGLNYLYQPSSTWFEQVEIESYFDTKNEHYLDSIDGVKGRYATDKVNISIKPTVVSGLVTVTPFIDVNLQDFTSRNTQNGVARRCNDSAICDVKVTQRQWIWGGRVDWRSEHSPLTSHFLLSQLRDDSDNIALNKHNNEKEVSRDNFVSGEFGINSSWGAYSMAGALSRGVRMPTLFELYGDRGAFKGNGNLKPEQSNGLSLSVDYTQANWSLNSAIYYKQIDDAIVATFNSFGIGGYGNVNEASLAGWELQADYQLTQDINFYGQINLINSKNKSGFVAFNNKKLPGVYHQEFSAKVSYAINDHWSVDASTQYSKGLYFNLANKVEGNTQGNGNPSDRWVTNLQANWQYQAYTLSIGVSNLLDEDYRDLANRPAQGRSFLIKFSFEE